MTTETRSFCLSASELNGGGQLMSLQFDAEAGFIRLRDRVLVEDDATAIGQPEGAVDRSWFEVLSPGVRIRKELVLASGQVHQAWLTWCGVEPEDNETSLRLSVNGVDVIRPATKYAEPQCKHYYTAEWAPSHFDNWFVVEVPSGALHDGVNTIDMWSDPGADADAEAWQVMVAADSERVRGADPALQPVGRSARSRDGGGTWLRKGLGQRDAIDGGEYCMRLSLEQHVPTGVYRSAAIDVTAMPAGEIHRRVVVQSCSVVWDVAGEGATDLRVRFADTPIVDSSDWSDWQPVSGLQGQWQAPRGRWMQFEASLTTLDALETPQLRGCRIEATVASGGADTQVGAHVVEFSNRRVTRSSVQYTWEDPSALRDLRQRFELDDLLEGAATEFERHLRLMHWAYRIPIGRLNPYAWRYQDLPQLERTADGSIKLLGPYDEPRRQGHCLYCNFTLIAALLSFGYPARWVNMSSKHTYGHEVTEVWSNDYDKWVFLDATRDYYMVDPDTAVPLSLREIGDRVAELLPAPVTWDRPIPGQLPGGVSPENVRVVYRQPDHGGPVFVDGAEHDMLMIGHLQMPLRNDFATRPQPVPWRISSNWGSSEFYCWSSPMFPAKLEYDNGTDRPQDWEPPLNRVQLTLVETAQAGVLRVHADTVTPWADGFEVWVDGDCQRQPGSQWLWPLHEGVNRLHVRACNTMGVCGPESVAVLTAAQGCDGTR